MDIADIMSFIKSCKNATDNFNILYYVSFSNNIATVFSHQTTNLEIFIATESLESGASYQLLMYVSAAVLAS